MERQPQWFCPPSELGNPQRTRVSTFPQRRRLRPTNRTKLLNPRKSRVSPDSRAEPDFECIPQAAKSIFVIGGGSCFSSILPLLLIFASSQLSSAPTSMAKPVQ